MRKRPQRKYLEKNLSDNTTYQYLCHTEKAVLRGKFIGINVFTKQEDRSQINILNLYLEELEKEQVKRNVNKSKEIIKITEWR